MKSRGKSRLVFPSLYRVRGNPNRNCALLPNTALAPDHGKHLPFRLGVCKHLPRMGVAFLNIREAPSLCVLQFMDTEGTPEARSRDPT